METGVFAVRQFAVDHYDAQKFLTCQGRCGYGFCKRMNTMDGKFGCSTSVRERFDFKTAEEVIDFALNMDRVLPFKGDANRSV